MGIHFDNLAAAIRHLSRMGWQNYVQQGRDFWVSQDGTCEAEILTLGPGTKIVMVKAWEVNPTDD